MTLSKLEDVYMNGFADDVSGDVDSSTGHFYRVGKYVVVTDTQGFHHVHEFPTVADSISYFNTLNDEYILWAGDDL